MKSFSIYKIIIFLIFTCWFVLTALSVSLGSYYLNQLNEQAVQNYGKLLERSLTSSLKFDIANGNLFMSKSRVRGAIGLDMQNSTCIELVTAEKEVLLREGSDEICKDDKTTLFLSNQFGFESNQDDGQQYTLKIWLKKNSIKGSFSVIFIIFLISTVLILSVMLGLIVYILRNFISHTENLIADTGKSIKNNMISSSYEIQKVKELVSEVKIRGAELFKSKIITEMASQVAHDIRSPLAALSVVENDLGEISEEKRLLIRGAINRIRDIANNLLSHNKETKIDQTDAATSVKSSQESVLLSSIIEPLVSEKRLQYRSNMDITIDFEVDSKYYGLFSSLDATEFKRVLSNIINNAVEAISGKGIVQVSLSEVESRVLISVSDNGKGMPEDLLIKLGQKGTTSGKQDGHGLGLHHAIATVKAWGGELNVQSTVNSGTTVNIKLAKAPTPDWFVPKIELIEGAHVVVIDDDSSIHGVWDGRFTSLKVQLLHFTEPKRFGEWFIENLDVSPVLFLVDFELLGSKETGLDIIQKYGIQKNSILVTSRFEEPQIREICRRLGVKLIPKGMAGFVPVGVSLC